MWLLASPSSKGKKPKKFSTPSNEVIAFTLMNEWLLVSLSSKGKNQKNAPLLSKEENTNPSNYMFNNFV
jgi:hypothetical protein